jgi:hypothetical protein
VYGMSDVRIGSILRYLSRVRGETGDAAGAIAAAREAVAAAGRFGTRDNVELSIGELALARALLVAGDRAAAEAAAVRALDASDDARVRGDVEGLLILLNSGGGQAPLLGAHLARRASLSERPRRG